MHSRTLFLLCTALRALRVLSLAHPGPTATDIASDYPDNIGLTPKPTIAPFSNSRHELRNLQKRQASLATTCGWFDGNAADPFYCDPGYACSTNLAGAYFGCCETDSAGSFLSDQCGYVATPYTNCVDYTKASACVGACATENLICQYSYPYCVLATMDVGSEIVSNWDCLTAKYFRVENVLTTISYSSGFGGGSSSAPIVITSLSSTPPDISPIVTTSSESSAGSSTTSATSNSSSSTQTSSAKSTTAHTAEIAGGVVGGLAALAAVLGGVIVWLHKRKQTQRKVIPPEISQTM